MIRLFLLPENMPDCPVSLLINPDQYPHLNSDKYTVTLTAGHLVCLGHSVSIKDHLLISKERLQTRNKNKDRPGYSNKHNGKHPHASQEKKKSHFQHTNTRTHTECFSNSLEPFLTHCSSKSGQEKNCQETDKLM